MIFTIRPICPASPCIDAVRRKPFCLISFDRFSFPARTGTYLSRTIGSFPAGASCLLDSSVLSRVILTIPANARILNLPAPAPGPDGPADDLAAGYVHHSDLRRPAADEVRCRRPGSDCSTVTFNLVATVCDADDRPRRSAARRQPLVGTVIGFTIATVLCGTADSLEALVFYRILQGVFGAPLQPLGQGMLLASFPKHSTPWF